MTAPAATQADTLPAPELELAYYTVATAPYYLGVVALLNSLRRLGERAPLIVLDCGLTPVQRARLAGVATVIDADAGTHPYMQKAAGLLARPAEVMVFIDADIIVTRPLGPLLTEAAAGRLVAFEDFHNHDRFFAQWSSPELGRAHQMPYVNSGFFAVSWETGRQFLPLFAHTLQALDLTETLVHRGTPNDPYFYPDQDVLNAILCTRFDGGVTRIERRMAPFQPFVGVEPAAGDAAVTADGPALCSYADGTTPFLLHHTHRKPWNAPVPTNPYSRLFSMLVTAPDACLPIAPRELPRRLTDRPFATVDRWRVVCQHAASTHLRGKLKLRSRLARLRERIVNSNLEVGVQG